MAVFGTNFRRRAGWYFWSDRLAVGKILAASIGFCSLTPGIAIVAVGGVGVQPVVLLLLAYIGLLPFLKAQLPVQSLLWTSLILLSYAASTVFSVSPSVSVVFSAMQGVYLILGAIGFSCILSAASQRQEFVRGYMTGALLSSVVSFAQMAYTVVTGSAISFANNANFAVVQEYGRGAAFTPESSALAALLIPAILICWFEQQEKNGLLASWQRGWPALTVLALGLAATKSSSIIYLPVLFVLVAVFQAKRIVDVAKNAARLLIPMVAVGVVFLQLYSTRATNAAAESSIAWRLTKIEAGLQVFKANPIIGAGVGLVSDQDYFEPFINIPSDLQWNTDPRKGVDSTFVRILAETGLVGLAAFYYPLVLFLRRVRGLCSLPSFRATVTLSLGLLFSQFFISGYRDQIIFLLPPIVFAIGSGIRTGVLVEAPERAAATARNRLALNPSAPHRSTSS